jgi:long-subunit acyl-CoA synthetase (AMP-forming)
VARLTRDLQGFGPVYRASEVFPDKPLVKTLYPEVTTLYENFRRGATKFPQNPCLGARVVLPSGERGEYFWQSYETVQKRFLAFGSGLLNYGLVKGDHLGIYSINNPEWVIAEQACYTQGIVPISLYDTLGPDAVAFILEQAGIKVSIGGRESALLSHWQVIVATKDKIPSLLQAAKSCPQLKLIIQMEKEGDKAIQVPAPIFSCLFVV